MPNAQKYALQTLLRGAQVLDLFEQFDSFSLKTATDVLELDRSVTYRLLRTWQLAGYLTFDTNTKQYFPGVQLLKLGARVHASVGLPHIERRLEQLRNTVGHTTSFTVLTGRFVLYLARVVANRALAYQVEIGKTLPAYATSAGQVQLAQLPDEEILRLYDGASLVGFTKNTPSTQFELLSVIHEIRNRGYAVNRGQHSAAIVAAAAIVRDTEGKAVGAFSVAGPSEDITDADLDNIIIPELLQATKQPVEL